MENKHTNAEAIELSIKQIFEHIGENPDREGLLDTPKRIVKMWKEIFRGYDPVQKPKITTFDNGKDNITCQSMVMDSGSFYSMCEHHMLPFFGSYYFAYIPHPKGKILGLSKIARVVGYHAAKLQIQERLVVDVIMDIAQALGGEYPPLGIALVMKGEHLCKTMRGVRTQGEMVASYMTGVFENGQMRDEFMRYVNSK